MKDKIYSVVDEQYKRAIAVTDSDNEELVLGRLITLQQKIKMNDNVFENTMQLLIIGKILELKKENQDAH